MAGSAAMPETRTLERPGGRVVSYASWGDPAGRPLLLLHGTPGSRLSRSPDPDLYARIRAHVVTFDRPGYGGSTVHPERTILSVADDAVAVADAPPVGREMLARPDVRATLVESLREAFVNGPQGWFDDSYALTMPWGFELGEVAVPVHMWYGEADRNVPLEAVKRMAEQLRVE